MPGAEGGSRHRPEDPGLSPWSGMFDSKPASPHLQIVFHCGRSIHTLDAAHHQDLGEDFLAGLDNRSHVHSESNDHSTSRAVVAGHRPDGMPSLHSAPGKLFSKTPQHSRPGTRYSQQPEDARWNDEFGRAAEHERFSVLTGAVLPRVLSSRGQPRALTAACPRWGRALTSRGSLFEEIVRAKQTSPLKPPQSAPFTLHTRSPTRKLQGKKRRVATAAGKAEAGEHRPKPNEPGFVPPPYTAPTVPDNQATQVDVVVHAFVPAENLPAAEYSPANPLALPKQQAPYYDLVRRQTSIDELPTFADLEPFVPDTRALKQMRYKQLRVSRKLATPPGKGPLARGLQHSHQIRAGPHKLLAESEAQRKSLENDENYYRLKLEKNPSDRHALLGYAMYLSHKKHLVDAEHTYLKLVELPFHGKSLEHADALYAYATFLWQTDRSEKAEHYFQLGLKFNTFHLGILRNLAMAMFLRGAYHGAMENFQRASLISPTDVAVKLGHVVCLEHLQNTSHQAIEKKYQEIFSLQPDYAPALFSHALFCKNHGRQKQAIEYYEKTLALAPNDATVLCSYGVLLSEEAFNK
jgi:tetratricopeptide (TPR) repeat protein